MLCLLYSLASGVEGIDILIADVGDQDSLERMCAEADVVIDCVGPVSLFNQTLDYIIMWCLFSIRSIYCMVSPLLKPV